ncbi:MAG TPA: ABC transporter ATP-binding protein [Candidatus Saccharimonadales bacterium]
MDENPQPTKIAYRSALKTIGRTLKLSWQLDKFQVLLFGFGALLEISGTLVSTYTGARLISLLFTAVSNHQQRHTVWIYLAATVAAQLATNLGFWLMTYSKRILYILASKWASLAFMRKLCEIDIQTFHDTESRNLINKLDSGYSWQISNVAQNSLDLIYGVVRAAAIIAVVATVAWWIAPFLVIFLIPSLIAQSKTAKAGWFVWDEKGDERHIFWGISYLMARAKHQLEIRALQAQDALIKTVDVMLFKFQLKQRTILRNANWIIGPAKVFEIVGIAATEVWLLVRLLYRGNISISSYIFYSGIISRINGALNTAVGSYTGMQETLLYANDFYGFQEVTSSIPHNEENGITLKATEMPEIVFKNVWFRYPNASAWVFEDLSFTIKRGEHIALIGENGAGKTTLVKLLLRFYDVERGSIEVNGHDLRELSLSSWYKQLGTLFQQFNEYPLDIEHNVTISGHGKKDEKKLKRALADSGVDDIAAKLPFGLETVLDSSFKKGTEPSGGQWQRVALARAFYRNANVLILDEPTAAIDAKAEYDIFNNIFKHQSEKTTIIISHRFSTVRRADRIVVIGDGKIIEQGSHAELMKLSKGLYKEMFEKQAEGYR